MNYSNIQHDPLVDIALAILEGTDAPQTIPANYSTPSDLNVNYSFYEIQEATGPFMYIGPGRGTLIYMLNRTNKRAVHDAIFIALKSAYNGGLCDAASIQKVLKFHDVYTLKPLKPDDIKHNLSEINRGFSEQDAARMKTRAGRVWTNIPVKAFRNKKFDFVTFWAKQNDIKMSDVKDVHDAFKLKNSILWVCSDSENFNSYGGGHTTNATPSKTKQLQSKLHPNLTHDQILAIIIKSHTAAAQKLTSIERDVVDEFRGTKDRDMQALVKKLTGGWDTIAARNYYSRMSEEAELTEEKITGLVNKAEKSGISYSILKQVYDRGMGAWETSHRPGIGQHQWAFARVNSFISGGKTRTTTDADLWAKHSK